MFHRAFKHQVREHSNVPYNLRIIPQVCLNFGHVFFIFYFLFFIFFGTLL